MKKVLYISYDGLTDPLGQSQILPYLVPLAKEGYQFTILSFEKADRFQAEKDEIRKITDAANIRWVPLKFTARPPVLAKIYDRWRMRKTALRLYRQDKFDMTHCRSYVAAEIGLLLKRRFGTPFLFDMRGFWADEKRDAGTWNQANPFYRWVYKYYKRKEIEYLQNADQVISLTEAARREILTWPGYVPNVSLQVIPCCTDMELFSLTDRAQKLNARRALALSDTALVLSYLGSVGTWYMLDEMLLLFKRTKTRFLEAKFLLITQTPGAIIENRILALGLDKRDFLITSASREKVPVLLKASDINVSFIKPVYSKISSCPTKLGEALSVGLPVICNSGIGDVECIVTNANAGFMIREFSEEDFNEAVEAIPNLLTRSPADIRNSIEPIFGLQRGVGLYQSCYSKILSDN